MDRASLIGQLQIDRNAGPGPGGGPPARLWWILGGALAAVVLVILAVVLIVVQPWRVAWRRATT